MKLKAIQLIILLINSSVFAQNLNDAVKKTTNERFAEAALDFNKLITASPNNAGNYFYAGENYFEKGVLDSAIIYWNESMRADPKSPLAFVGSGKAFFFKKNITDAQTQFSLALKMTKNKNAEVLRCIAKTYLTGESKNLDEAIRLLTLAIKRDPSNIEGHLLMGDALNFKTPENGSLAIKSYNEVLKINSKSPQGIVRVALLYQRAKNYKLADSLYKVAKRIDSTYAPAYRENAELNMTFGQTKKAIENWKNYLSLNNSIESRYRYAVALFKGKEYCNAIQELLVISSFYKEYFVDRMLTYSYYECTNIDSNTQKGLSSSSLFFNKCPPEKVDFYDFLYRGKLYLKSGQDSLAIVDFEKASSMDEKTETEMLSEIAKIYFKLKKYPNAIQKLEKKRESTSLNAAEYFDLGRSYYYEGKDYTAADSAFSMVLTRSPKFASAYIFKARSQNKKGKEKENIVLAELYYKEALACISQEERLGKSKSIALEAAKFLGSYYRDSNEKDLVKAKEHWEIVLTLDPEDKQAKTFLGIK